MVPERLTDLELCALFRTNRDVAWAECYRRYWHLVRGVAFKYLKNTQESEDLAMHIFERLHSDLSSREIANLGGWLHRVTVNACLMQLRGMKTEIPVYDSAASVPPVEEDTWLEAGLHKLEACLKLLNRIQRSCVELFYLNNKSYNEVCAELALDFKAVKSHLQNARRNLKICVETGSARQ